MSIPLYLMEFIAGTKGVCEATHSEQHTLWREYHKEYGWPWIENSSGYLFTVGYFHRKPTVISLSTAVVKGYKILFWEATSQVVDYRLTDKWLRNTFLKTPRSDATNFVNIFHELDTSK